MKRRAPRIDDPAALREQAEAFARKEAAQASNPLSPPAPEDAQRALHELQVHQIELRMQNEELRRAERELEASWARYFELYDLAPVGYLILSEKGLILDANPTAATLLGATRSGLVRRSFSGFILPEDGDLYYRQRRDLLQNGHARELDLRMLKTDGTTFWGHLVTTAATDADGARICRVVLSNINERKLREDGGELTARLIMLVNTPGDFRELMSKLTVSLQGWSGCEAVGIRLKTGDDFPYWETRGFPPGFAEGENHLCAYGRNGEILRDDRGQPVLECLCGKVLRGRLDPGKPYFTAHGSFWSNSATMVLAKANEADGQGGPRNRCQAEGYESVALIPLRAGRQVFGLIQFNDHRPDRFTPGLIGHFERMADSLAIALSQRRAEETLRESERFAHATIDSLSAHLCVLDETGTVLAVNRAWRDFARANSPTPDNTHLGESYLKTCDAVTGVEAGDAQEFAAGIRAVLSGRRDDFRMEYRCDSPSERRWFIGRVTRFGGEGPTRLAVVHTNITERKQAEDELRRSHQQLRALAARVEAVREEERTRVAREIHDVLAQELTRLKMDIVWLKRRLAPPLDPDQQKAVGERLAVMTTVTDTAIQTVQKIATELRPVVLDSLGLCAAVEWQARDFQARTGIVCVATVPERDLAVDRNRSTAMFRVMQEGLTNVLRHARATRVEVILSAEEDQLILRLQDNGCGIPPEKLQDPRSIGLVGMRERALLLEGHFEIRSQPGAGATLEMTLPLPRNEKPPEEAP